MPRELVEKNLEFLGLVILENRLKEPTVGVIKMLRDANIHVIMITGTVIKNRTQNKVLSRKAQNYKFQKYKAQIRWTET